jgi:DNA-binding NarL/FixJ family response regulator
MKRVMLVDDHGLFREALATVLRHGTDLQENIQAGSLAEAHRVLVDLDVKVDLAIVDIDLPNGDGADLIKELREVDVPVLALILGHSLQGRARAVQAGAEEILGTAASGEEIVQAAERLVGG